jgi:foldase protein PrsA
VKRNLFSVMLVLAALSLASLLVGCNSELPGDAVAKVGEVYISAEDFEDAVAEQVQYFGITKDAQPDAYQDLRRWVLENLVVAELARQQAEELGIEVTDEEVQDRVDEYVAYYYSGDQANLVDELTAQGMTLEDLQTDIREGMLTQKVEDEVLKDITEVPEEEVAAYYQDHKADYYVEASRNVRHILVIPEAGAASSESGQATTTTASITTTETASDTSSSSGALAGTTDADWAAALATAEEVRTKLIAGGDWTELAKEYSGDFKTKDSGGDLGVVHLGETIAAFEEASFSLELEEISEPVRTVYGYEIIQVTSITEEGEQPLDEVRDQIESKLLSDKQGEAWTAWVEAKKSEVGVIYRKDLQPTPTTPAEETTTTVAADTTTSASS